MDITIPKSPRPYTMPLPVGRAIQKLGQDIRDARLRRRIPVALMAERAGISRITLNKIENGEPGTSLGSYTTVLFVLGLEGQLADLADVRNDEVGLRLKEERLPKRIRKSTTRGKAWPGQRNYRLCQSYWNGISR